MDKVQMTVEWERPPLMDDATMQRFAKMLHEDVLEGGTIQFAITDIVLSWLNPSPPITLFLPVMVAASGTEQEVEDGE